MAREQNTVCNIGKLLKTYLTWISFDISNWYLMLKVELDKIKVKKHYYNQKSAFSTDLTVLMFLLCFKTLLSTIKTYTKYINNKWLKYELRIIQKSNKILNIYPVMVIQ